MTLIRIFVFLGQAAIPEGVSASLRLLAWAHAAGAAVKSISRSGATEYGYRTARFFEEIQELAPPRINVVFRRW
jgi:hypothetical protein